MKERIREHLGRDRRIAGQAGQVQPVSSEKPGHTRETIRPR